MIGRLVAALAAVLVAVAAFAQDTPEPSARITRAAFDPPSASPGGTATLKIEFTMGLGSHIYAQKTPEGGDTPDAQRPVFRWELPKGWTAGKVVDVSKPHEFSGFGSPELVHEGTATLAQTFTLAADAATGTIELKGLADYQVCNDSMCGTEHDVAVSAKLDVASGAVTPAVVAPAVPPAAEGAGAGDDDAPATWGDILSQALFWGLLTVMTPCVFPLLPVTVSFFSKQQGPPLPRALVYATGIVFTITVVGLVFKSGLDVMARGWEFNAAVGVLFLVLSLSLFGLFDLRLPGFLTDWSASKTGSGGMAGPFFMAVTLALTSFSCSMPFLAVMFTQFERGNYAQSVVGLVVYGSTMAFPFFLCSLFPAAIQSLPRAGAWMNAVKVTMGFVEFALAFKFLRTVALQFGSDALPRGFVLAIWAACAFGAALYLLGHIVLPHDTKPESIGVFRLVFAIAFLSAAIYLLPGIFGRPVASWIEGFIQTQSSEVSDAGFGGRGNGGHKTALDWKKNDWDGALQRAAASRRVVLFDFTGVG